ncbi:MAG: hypothetical protein FGM43_06110 [Sinobacteraceae bacterium]|nr:hypothetical protein [Nevskiaceae bacterium]
MTRQRKRLLLIVGGLLASIALGVVLVVVFRNPLLNSALVRKEVSAVLREEVGRKVDLSGALRIDEWPWVELDVGRGSIANPAGFEGPPLAQWELIEMRFHYSTAYEDEPLLYGVIIHGLKVHLHIDAAGRDNFSDLGSRDPTPPSVPLNVPRVEIRDAEVSFTDERESTKPKFVARSITLRTGTVERGVGAVEGKRWRIADIDLSAQPLNLGTAVLRVPALSVDASIPAARVPAATLSLGPIRLRLSDLAVAAPEGAAVQGSGRFALDPVPIAAALKAAGQKPPFAADSPWFRLRGLSGRLQQSPTGLQIDDLRVGMDDLRLQGSVSIGRTIRFALEGNRLDLDRYINALADQTPAAPTAGFPGKTLLGLPLEGSVRLDSAVSGGLRMQDVTLEVTDRGR